MLIHSSERDEFRNTWTTWALISSVEKQKNNTSTFFLYLMNMEANCNKLISEYVVKNTTIYSCKRLPWSRGGVLAFSTQVRGFKPGRSRRIFRAKKTFSTPSFGGQVKPSVQCRRFAACKISLNLCGSRNLGKITGDNFLAHISTFRC